MATVGAIVLIALAVAVHGRRNTHVDAVALRWLSEHVTGGWVRVTLDATTPAISLALLAVVVVAALAARRYRLAVLAVLAPAVASGLVEYVLKPLVGRPYGTTTTTLVSLSYPSGHETLVGSAALVAVLALLQTPLPRAVRALATLVLTVWTFAAGVGLVVNWWHYTTDVVGALGLCLAVVLGGALLADGVSSPAVRDRTRTARAA